MVVARSSCDILEEDFLKKFSFQPVPGVKYRNNYVLLCEDMNALLEKDDASGLIRLMRIAAEDDLFFLLYFILDCRFLNTAFHVPKIAEVQALNHNTLDLWAREHGKSTILTYGLIIWQILKDPEITIGIFSHTRAIAKGFLRRIKTAFEVNERLRMIWPHVIPQNPQNDVPKWSENDGLLVIRNTIVPEATLEAWGLDEMPTSKHFMVLHYDDIETDKSVSTPDQIEKTAHMYKMSLNLGRLDGLKRVIGTIYHPFGLMVKLKDSKDYDVRFYPGEDEDGKPALLTRDQLDRKKREMGPYVYATQILLTPVTKENQKFKMDWLSYYKGLPRLNIYITVDPAKSKSKRADSTTMWVWGVDEFKNTYILDCIRDKLNLKERWEALAKLVRKWKPMAVGYEEYALMSDMDYIKEKQLAEGLFFTVEGLGGRVSKEDRILTLVPEFVEHRIKFPPYIGYTDYTGKVLDLVQVFVMDEYLKFPYVEHDDMLDALARKNNMTIVYPMTSAPKVAEKKPFDPLSENGGTASWLSA